ncbi:acyl-CoA dehydrogenase family protein [Sporichthya sp.]|uniref:acyl-CoA dehydrogenase family protein n=1 Tax=Sporichthya sp. TaxID=65475 RepID=UPI0017F9CAE5|nr:acyl-CoA dehydrogenase family protein [Sporichthya sp.]MBA3744516.1 acyl-CoA dehydrogenase [Sporichthya sp.]
MERSELALMREALSDLVLAHPGDLRAALGQFGWAELMAEDPAVAVDLLFRLQGEHLTAESLLDEVLLDAIPGATAVAVAFPVPPRTEPGSTYGHGQVRVQGLLTRPLQPSDVVLIPCAAVDGLRLVEVAIGELTQTPADVLDSRRPWTRLSGIVNATASTPVGDVNSWPALLASGRRALAAELLGIGDKMLTLAVEHTTTREQFGQKLSSFQVVRHKLADVRVWGEVADLAAAAAWEDTAHDPTTGSGENAMLAAALAKSAAVRYVATAREHVQQLLGGMGFSWEHEFHWYLRRALVLEALLGGATTLRTEIGASIVESGRLPDLAAL